MFSPASSLTLSDLGSLPSPSTANISRLIHSWGFFTVTLDRPDLARRLTIVPYPRRIPTVLSVEEVMLLLQAASGPEYKAAVATAYGAGLRVSEVVALKVVDIDSERMLLRIERGKGGKDRYAMLSP